MNTPIAFLHHSQRFIILLVSCLLIFTSSCKKEEVIIEEEEETNNIDVGEYSLLPESLELLPYLGKERIVFIDSLGNTTNFQITEFDLFSSSSTYIKYDIFELGDTVEYDYRAEIKRFSLTNDSLSMTFNMSLSSKPYYNDPESQAVADVLTIFCTTLNDPFSGFSVFYDLTNQRTYPSPFTNISIDELELFGRTFQDVIVTDYTEPKSLIQFNYEFGIISFTDHEGKTWRFEALN